MKGLEKRSEKRGKKRETGKRKKGDHPEGEEGV
jgi:hypothetical protein